MARLASGLPKDPTQNGLFALAGKLLDEPLERHLVFAVVDCSKITTETSTGERDATVRILRIEQVHPDDRLEAERLVRRALEFRMGDTVLPIDIERDMEEWFNAGFTLDTETGELTPTGSDPDDDGEPDSRSDVVSQLPPDDDEPPF